jgi:hypothetical protein
MMQARVQVHDVGENIIYSGDLYFLGGECKEPNVIRDAINYTEKFLALPGPISFSGPKMLELNL